LQPRRELRPTQTRHDDVGDEQRNRLLALFADEQRLAAVGRLDHVIAEPAQDLARQPANALIVLGDQDGLIPSPSIHRDRQLDVGHDFVDAWQIDLKRRSPPELAVDPYPAAALLDDAVDHREPQTGPFARLLRGEERLEDERHVLRADSMAGIAKCQQHVLAWPERGMALDVDLVYRDVARFDR